MDELEIKMLEANGYSYRNGGIVDTKGEYVSALELNGKTLRSESSKDLWDRAQTLDKKHSTSVAPWEKIKKNEEYVSSNMEKEYKTTTTVTLNKHINSSIEIYKYPLVLVASIIIYITIKRLTK